MSYKPYITNSQSGFALVTVLLLVSLLAVIGITLNRTTGLQTAISYNLKGGEEAYYVAAAGFQHGLFMLRRTPSLRGVVFTDKQFGNGSYTVSISDAASPMGNVLVSSAGQSGSAQRTVRKRITLCVTCTVYPTLVKDTYLNQGAAGLNYGVSPRIGVGTLDATARAVFEYDLSMIPAGADIKSAVFELYMFDHERIMIGINFIDVAVHRMTRSWNEGIKDGADCESGATWNMYNCVNAWIDTGGDFNSNQETKTIVLYSAINQWHQWDVKNLIQQWVDNPSSNFGMMLKDQKEGNGNMMTVFLGYFYSDEYSDAGFRPKLTVTYTPP